MRQLRNYKTVGRDEEEDVSYPFDEGVESVVYIRCMEHKAVPQINVAESGDGECGECIRRQCWKDMLGLIAATIEGTPIGMDGQDALAALEESLLVNGIGSFGVPDERESKFHTQVGVKV